jgi:hypothetical protein
MTLHMIKLCVGAETVEDVLDWQRTPEARGPDGRPWHVTRMWPKAADEVLAGGSLYWVIKGLVTVRQRIVGLERIDMGDGIARCAIVLDPALVRTLPQPRRPFQGWRYLKPAEAPADLGAGRGADGTLPPKLAAALAEIGIF